MKENEIRNILNSIKALKNLSNDMKLSFHYEDSNEEIDAIKTVIDTAIRYVNQFIPLSEEQIQMFSPIYDSQEHCWILPTTVLKNGFYGFVFNETKQLLFGKIIPFENDRYYSIKYDQNAALIEDNNNE